MFVKHRPSGNRLVVFTPLPPLENGIADYAAELMPLLAAARDTVVVIDDHAPQPTVRGDWEFIRLAEYSARESEFAEADHLYQLGNNPDHIYLMPWLLKRPGIVVLHDVSLHHLVDQATLQYGDIAGYGAALELEYGAAGRLLADQFERLRWRGRSMFFELPMTRELLSRARAVIVHSLYAATKVSAQHADLPVELVRHHVAPSAKFAGGPRFREEARRHLGLTDDTVLLVSLGFVTRAKRIDTTLRFLHLHRATLPPVRYIIAGQDLPQDFDVRALITSLGLDDIVEITGYIDEAGFYRCIAASDIVVNLRYPSGGETSGTLIRALGAGACLVVNDIGSFAEYPDDVCAKVPVTSGVADDDYEDVMLPLVRSQAARHALSRAARRYMRDTHSIEESARRYLRTLRQYRDQPVPPLASQARRALLTASRREALLRDMSPAQRRALPLWASEGVLPCAVDGTPDRALLVGGPSSHAPLLQTMTGYLAEVLEVSSLASAPASRLAQDQRRTHALAVLELDVEGAGAQLAPAAIRLNARLQVQGHLALTLVAQVGIVQGNVIASARRVLEACGFAVEQVLRSRETLSFAMDADGGAGEPFSDSIVMRVRKVSEFISPRAASAWDSTPATTA